jgi:hypothetical protein
LCCEYEGVENINTQVVKDSFAVIGEVLTSIVNESIETGKVPKVFKISTVLPIQKVIRTIRPINMLPVYEKICEIAIKNQLIEYIEKNNILIKQQSGFRKFHSSETALNWVLE